MSKTDACELELMAAFDKGALKSVATKAELAKFKAAARATLQGKRVNTRLWSGDWQDLQANALKQGMPDQTLMARVRHPCATGRLAGR